MNIHVTELKMLNLFMSDLIYRYADQGLMNNIEKLFSILQITISLILELLKLIFQVLQCSCCNC